MYVPFSISQTKLRIAKVEACRLALGTMGAVFVLFGRVMGEPLAFTTVLAELSGCATLTELVSCLGRRY